MNNKKDFIENLDIKEDIKRKQRKDLIAKNILENKISVDDLTDKEIIEMTEYFNKEIEKLNDKLLRIKKQIIEMNKN